MSEIRATTISDAAGTGPITLTKQYPSKMWVRFNGSGTIAVDESQNVSSLTDKAGGNYGINLTSSMSNENYVWSCGTAQPTSGATYSLNRYANAEMIAMTSSVLPMWTGAPTGTSGIDYADICASIHGDLA